MFVQFVHGLLGSSPLLRSSPQEVWCVEVFLEGGISFRRICESEFTQAFPLVGAFVINKPLKYKIMETKFSKEIPAKLGKARNGFMLNYNIKETPMEEIERQWRLSRGGMEGEESSAPDAQFIAEHQWMYNEVRIPQGQWNYGGIINAIVRDRYTVDEMEAITNNMAAINAVFMQTLVSGGIVEAIKFLKDSADANDTETFREMQEWRAMAKKEAKGLFGMQ
jgi:hypothetical protein